MFGIFLGEIGDRIPLWNKYIGGGTILVLFAASILATYNLITEFIAGEEGQIVIFYNENPVAFLDMFILTLIV